jgi:hypothetical protein
MRLREVGAGVRPNFHSMPAGPHRAIKVAQLNDQWATNRATIEGRRHHNENKKRTCYEGLRGIRATSSFSRRGETKDGLAG